MKNFANGKTAIEGEVHSLYECHRLNESSLVGLYIMGRCVNKYGQIVLLNLTAKATKDLDLILK